jgi:hypothetical protein
MAEVNDRLIIEFEAKLDKLVAGVAAGNREVRNFARQAEKDLTDLQLKLEIAQARGDKAAAQGLRDQIQLQQTKQRLLRSGIELTEAQAQAEAHLAAVISARHKAEEGGAGVALERVFDQSKLAVIEEGSAKLRVFGSAIEPLGGFGIAAAVGVVALVEAVEQVKKAGEEVGQLSVRADRLGVGVEALQALDFAAKESHVSAEALDQSLEALNGSLGKLRQGVGDKRLIPEAALIGLNTADIAKYKDAADFLPALIEKINALPTLGEKVNAASKFGIEPLLPLILKGKEGVAELEAEFSRLGVTVSTQTARDIEEGNLALERASEIAHDKVRNSLLELHPLLVQAGTWWDDFAAHAVDGFAKAVIGAKVLAGALAHEKFGPAGGVPQTAPQSAGEGSGTPAKSGAAPSGPTAKQIKDQADAAKELETLQASLLDKTTHRLEAERKIAEIEAKQGHALDAQLKARLLGAASKEDAAPGLRSASAAARKAEEARKKAEEQAKASDDLVFQAQEGLLTATRAALQAQLGATKDGDERARLQAQMRDLDAEHARVLLARKNADIEARIRLGQIDLLDGIIAEAINTEASKRQVSADAIAAKADVDLRAAQKAADAEKLTETAQQGQIQRLQIEAALQDTRQQRLVLERQILELTYQEQKQKLQAVIDGSPALYSPDQKKQASAELDNLNQLHPLQQRQLEKNSAGPLDQYLNSFQNLNDEIENDGVAAIHDLTTGLVNAALHAKNLGQVAEEVFLNLIAKVLEQSIEQEAAPALASGFKALLAFVPGFAGGTNSTPSGPIIVGENGPEILNPGPGMQIISNSAIRSAGSGVRSGGGSVYAPTYNDLRGSIVANELYDRINRGDAAAAQVGAQQGHARAMNDVRRAGYLSQENQ